MRSRVFTGAGARMSLKSSLRFGGLRSDCVMAYTVFAPCGDPRVRLRVMYGAGVVESHEKMCVSFRL